MPSWSCQPSSFFFFLSFLSHFTKRGIATDARGKSELSSRASRLDHIQKISENCTGCVNGSEGVEGWNDTVNSTLTKRLEKWRNGLSHWQGYTKRMKKHKDKRKENGRKRIKGKNKKRNREKGKDRKRKKHRKEWIQETQGKSNGESKGEEKKNINERNKEGKKENDHELAKVEEGLFSFGTKMKLGGAAVTSFSSLACHFK